MQATFTVLFLAALLLSRVQALTDEFDRASKDESQPLNIWPFLQFATRYRLRWVMRSLVLDAKRCASLRACVCPAAAHSLQTDNTFWDRLPLFPCRRMMGLCAALLVHSLVEVGRAEWRACMRCRAVHVVQLLLLRPRMHYIAAQLTGTYTRCADP